MKRSAKAHWQGNLKQGKGFISTESGVLQKVPYSFAQRFESERGTNPEELIGAAHSSCFAMAFSAELEKQNLKAQSIQVEAQVTLAPEGGGWSIPDINLSVQADVPNASYGKIEQAAQAAKLNCPVSKLLKANITMTLTTSGTETQASL